MATSSNIAEYNTFVQGYANAGHTAIQPYGSQFKVIGCTATTSARVNTGTTGTGTDISIYWMNGPKVADDYADFYDGTWDVSDLASVRNEDGNSGNGDWPSTGCDNDGTAHAQSLGSGGTVIQGASHNPTNGPINQHAGGSSSTVRPFYALSPVFVVGNPVPPILVTGAPALSVTGAPAQITQNDNLDINVSLTAAPTYTVRVEVHWRREAFNHTSSSPVTGENPRNQRIDEYFQFEFTPTDYDTVRTLTFQAEDPKRNASRTLTVHAYEVVPQMIGNQLVRLKGAVATQRVTLKVIPVAPKITHLNLSIPITDVPITDDDMPRPRPACSKYYDRSCVTMFEGKNSHKLVDIHGTEHERDRAFQYSVVLDTQPGPEQTFTVTPKVVGTHPSKVRFDPTSITFNNSSSLDQSFTVYAEDDTDMKNESFRFVHVLSGDFTGRFKDGKSLRLWFGGTIKDDDKNSQLILPIIKDMNGAVIDDGNPILLPTRPWRSGDDDYYITAELRARDYAVVTLKNGDYRDEAPFRMSLNNFNPGVMSPVHSVLLRFTPENWDQPQRIYLRTTRNVENERMDNLRIFRRYTKGAETVKFTIMLDSEIPQPEVSIIGSFGATEGEQYGFTLQADPAPASGQTLDVGVTITATGDFGVQTGTRTVTIDSNGYGALTVDTTDDEVEEPDGTLSLTINPGSDYTLGAVAALTLDIEDDDGLSEIKVTTEDKDDNTLPTAHPLVKYASLVKSFYDRITANHQHGDSASGGWNKRFLKAMGHPEYINYPQAAVTVADATKMWNHGGPGANTAWNGTVDAVTYAQEYFSGLTVPPPTPEPEVTIEAGSSISEGGGASFTLQADPVPTAPLEVTVTVATEGDYGITTGERTVTIPTTGSYELTLTTNNDETDESDGSVTVTVDAGEGYTVGSDSSGTITIEDDDAPATVLPAAHPLMKYATLVKRFYDRITDSHQHGDSASGGWNKRFLKAMGHPEYVDYPQTAVTVADATQMWNHGGPGANTAWDGTVDAVTYAEQYFAGLTVVPPPTLEPEVTIEAGSGVSEGGGASFTLKADPAPAAPLQVGVTIGADGDFGITAGTQSVTIPVSGSYTLSLTTENDGTDEPDGSVTVTVNAGTGYTVGAASTGTVAITDDDLPPPQISVTANSASVTEGTDATFTVSASSAPDSNLSVTLTVSEATGSDFVAPADEGSTTVTIEAGKTEATLTVTTDDDQTQESDGTVTATANAGSGYQVAASPNDTASIAVTDNDVPPAVPTLSIDDATGPEGKPMMFTIRLSAPSKQTVRVSIKAHESNPVSARANRDFIAAYYLVTFRPGETEQRRGFYIRDDSHDDGGETFEVRIRWAGDTPVADGVGVGTIENSDPLPAAYLSRFGRTVAEQAIEGIAQRFDAARTPGMEGTLAGQALRFDVPGSDPSSPAEVIHSVSPTDRLAEPFGGDSHLSPSTSQSYGMSSQELLLNSSFTLTGESDSAGGTLALWGRTSQQSFDGTERGDGTDIRLDGKVTTTLLGTDYANNDLLLGLALAHSTGDGDYGAMSDEGVHPCENTEEVLCDDAIRAGDGTIESSLSALIPYASVSVSPRLKLWGAAGHGSGEVKVKVAEGESYSADTYSADTSWSMAAAGMRAAVIEAPKEGSGGTLTLTSDYLWTQISSDKTMDLAASKSKVTRLRFGLEGGYHMAMADGGSFVPKLQIGARHDGGDAETGFGIELGGGLSWQSPALGLQFELEGRTLVSHDDEDFENRGFAVSLAYDENAKSERGASFALRQHIGAPSSGGLDALFASEPLSKRSGNDAQRRVTLEGAYGLPALGGHYTASPYGQMSFGETSRDYTIGWRWTPVNDAQDLSFGFKAVRSESLNAETENRFGFEAVARW